ncbi:MAG: hypothetical protein IT521_01945 [Burkholderiales bacterium]|nr:hypothetical protein [Burkholderiales bacterium]
MPNSSASVRGTLRRVGVDREHHFFGYYNKCPWDRSGSLLLANRVSMMDADVTPAMTIEVGYFDLDNDERFISCDRTGAWNWQMGCQLQWLDGDAHRSMIYNVRAKDTDSVYPGFGSAVYDIDTGVRKTLPLPVYVVSPDSRFALCVDYSRLYITHETIGYVGEDAPGHMPNAPADDGIHYMNIGTGESRLIISYADLLDFKHVKSMDKALHWVSHIEINPTSARFLLLHRWTERVKDETCFLHRLITVDPDGSDMRLLEDSDHPLPQLDENFDPNAVGTYDYEKSEYQISHPLWCANDRIVVWGPHAGSINYQLYTDAENGEVETIGKNILNENGHMSFSPTSPRWMVSDTYPNSETHERILFLYDVENENRHDIGSFYADPVLRKENRCDLHPRWSRDGKQICIDSVHESERQMYVLDVSGITGN